MGKYGGLSGQYSFKTKKEAEKSLKAAKKHAAKESGPGYNMRITGSRGFWTLVITKKRKKAKR